ncbi:MAG: hypothetical protein ACR2M1_12965 [Gemmatimonadaceae bacterium]
MTPDIRGYHLELRDGWKLTVNAWSGYTVAWLTNRGLDTGFYETELPGETMLDLEALGYVPSVYSEGVEAPPLVLFHSAQLELAPYVWEPASGRFYQAGGM